MVRQGLIPKLVTARREGKAYQTTVWIRPNTPDEKKSHRVRTLLKKFPRIQTQVNRDMKNLKGVDKRAALATKVIMYYGVRAGNEKSAEGYNTNPHPLMKNRPEPKFVQTYGLTTLKKEHVAFEGDKAVLHFSGKKSVEQSIDITQKDLVEGLKELVEKQKGDTLFGITPYELTRYIKQNIGKDYSPKDLRGMLANTVAIKLIAEASQNPHIATTVTEINDEIKGIADKVSKVLGNTGGVAKRAYIDPYLLNQYKGMRIRVMKEARKKK